MVANEVGRVMNGKFVMLPLSVDTRDHGSHTIASLWGEHLRELLEATSR